MSRRRKAEPLPIPARKPFSARLWPRSLAFRVIGFSTIWAILTLIVIFTLITTLYRQASERGFDSLLSAHLFNLIGSVGVSETGQLTGAPDLGDLRFSEPNSGWYWSVEPASEGVHGDLHSSSMTDDDPVADRRRGAVQFQFPAQLCRPTASTARNWRCSRANSSSTPRTAPRASA